MPTSLPPPTATDGEDAMNIEIEEISKDFGTTAALKADMSTVERWLGVHGG